MKRVDWGVWMTVALATVMAAGVGAATERSEIPGKYKWDLTPVYADAGSWERDRARIAAEVPTISKYQGRLGESAGVLLEALDRLMAISQDVEKLNTWAYQVYDQDTRVSASQERQQAAQKVAVDFGAAAAYFRPELIGLGPDKVKGFMAAEARLAPYAIYLDDVVRWAPHTLNPAEEKLVAQAGDVMGSPGDVYSIFTNADFPAPEVTLSTGDKVTLDASAYTYWRATPNRDDRVKVFQTFFGRQNDYRRTLATTLFGHVKAHIFNKDARHFKSCLEAALFGDNLPTTVYTQLIADAHAGLPTLHRYLRLRQRMMGLASLGYEDLYAPIVKDISDSYTPEQAVDMVLEAAAPLGKEYVDALRGGLIGGGWVDWMPSTGKRSGAYSTVTYGYHPYQLLNFTGTYDEVSTLAHESGHSMHSYLSSKHQPYVNYNYATFVAEVASTLNENLLLHTMLGEAKNDDTRLFLLGNHLESLRTTLFRQAMFAEFELKIHEMAEAGQPLSGDNLNDLYLKICRTYYGHDQGVCAVDSVYASEWTYIPHFYRNFYVFQYATSLVASTSLANAIRDEQAMGEGKTARRDAYLKMLSAGSSKYPIDLLKDAGVDMTTSAPFQAAMREMNATMDQMEAILSRRK